MNGTPGGLQQERPAQPLPFACGRSGRQVLNKGQWFNRKQVGIFHELFLQRSDSNLHRASELPSGNRRLTLVLA